MDLKALAEIRELLGDAPRRRDLLIEFLHRIQDRYHHISVRHILALGEELRLPLAEIYEVATFYHHFDVVSEGDTPPPELTVRVCESVTCEMFGGDSLVRELKQDLEPGVRVQRVPCVGRCHGAPVAVVGMNPIEKATPQTVLQAVQSGDASPEKTKHIDYQRYREQGGYQTLRACIASERTAEEVVTILEDSSLRGLGGAGFPTGRKWRILRQQPKPRLIAINIDEGEPGTFKDRYYLERDPHRFLEGTLIAAWAIEADQIYLYLRDEYAGCREMLSRELKALRDDPPCTLPLYT